MGRLRMCERHKNYSIYFSEDRRSYYYSDGSVESLQIICGEDDLHRNKIAVQYRSGEQYTWETKHIDEYNIGQFGIAVSTDGTMVFAQTWDNGLFCLDAKTGIRIWKTKSRRGITNIFVNDDTITVQLHDYVMQLIDIKTGTVIKEKRPCTAWGFTSLNNRYIVCQVTARKWEIIEAETLETKESFTHREFTGGHTDFCVNNIELCDNGKIRVAGFKNVFRDSENSQINANIVFEHFLDTNFNEGKLK